jgi:hypothetical protein
MAEDQQQHYDPYYRAFPSNLLPVRTPFTRAGQHDAGHVFIYMTRKWVRWSLLLDHTRLECIYDEARECIPSGFSQFWLLEKRYSTQKPRMPKRSSRFIASGQSKAPGGISEERASEPHPTALEEKLYVALREPPQQPDGKGDMLSYHLHEAGAVAAADAYTRQFGRRAVVGLLLWDELWF